MIIVRVLRIGEVANKDIIQTIKDKEMDRKEFLKYSGLALLAFVGLRAIASMFIQSNERKITVESNEKSSRGFGSGRYGS